MTWCILGDSSVVLLFMMLFSLASTLQILAITDDVLMTLCDRCNTKLSTNSKEFSQHIAVLFVLCLFGTVHMLIA